MTEEEKESNEINHNEDLVDNVNSINLDNHKRNIIFIFLVLIAILSACDGGIIPQQNSNIQEDFDSGSETKFKNNDDDEDDKEEKKVGLFGSIDYIGRVVGAFIFTMIMGKMNRKNLLISTLIFKGITLFSPFTKDYTINTMARCLSGLSQVFYPTYLPVWCDQYAKKNNKTLWVTLVQIGNPIGIIIGYGLGTICEPIISSWHGWRLAFIIEGIILIICAIVIWFFDDIYFSEKFVLVEDSKGKLVELTEEQKNTQMFKNLGDIISNKIFIFSSLCNSVAFFGIGVVQFYGDKYMKKVLEIGDSVRFVLFGLLCLFGPTTGMVCGGIICSKLGGYIKRSAMTFVILCMSVASIISMCIACHEIKALFVISGWTYLFAIGGVIPPLSGIIISCLDNKMRGDGFSFCNFLNNLLGNFPSSYIYSLLVDAFDKNDNSTDKYRYAWMITMSYNFVGLLFVVIGGTFRFKIKGDLSEDTNNEAEETEEKKEINENKEIDEKKEPDENEE